MRFIGAFVVFAGVIVSACGAAELRSQPVGISSGEPGGTSPLPSLSAASWMT